MQLNKINIDKEHFIFQHCDTCDNDVLMQWNTAEHSFAAYCPFCGERLFLCSACVHNNCDGDKECDWKCDINGEQSCMFTRTF